jgi:hypothetical protein
VTPLAEIHRHLSERDIDHALIGAAALSLHGYSRATSDLDLLVTRGDVLRVEFWDPLVAVGWKIELLRGEFDDPLAGSAVLEPPAGAPTIDVVVGKWKWQTESIERADRVAVLDIELPVVRAADLVLLKLDAGGPQDASDVRALLGVTAEPARLRAEVEERLDRLSPAARRAWLEIAAR